MEIPQQSISRWVMSIIVHYGNACYFTLVLETTVCTGETAKSFYDHVIRDLKKLRQGDRRKGIGNVVFSRYF